MQPLMLHPPLFPYIVGGSGGGGGSGEEVDLTSDLMAYWDMSASGADSGPRGNHLSGVNTPVFVSGGKPGNCTDLEESSDQYFVIANNGDIVLSATDFTLAGWANLESTGGLRRIFGKGDISTAATFEYALYFNNASRFAFSVGDGSAVTTVTDNAQTVLTGFWYFVVARYNSATQQISICVNDSTPRTASFTGTVLSGGNPLRVGNDQAGSTRRWDGLLDSLGIWKRFLNSSEITSLYNGGSGKSFAQL